MAENFLKTFAVKHKLIISLAVIQMIVLTIFLYGYMLIVADDDYKTCFSQGKDGNVSAILRSGDEVQQEIPINDSINGIAVLLATWGNEVTGGTVKVQLLDELQDTVYEATLDATLISDNQYITFEFEPIYPKTENAIYTLRMVFEGVDDQTISFWMTDNNKYDDVDFTLNNESSVADMVLSERVDSRHSRFLHSYLVIMLLLDLLITVSYVMIFVKKMRLHYVFLFVGFFSYLVYMIIVPIDIVPDEQAHLYSAYSVSNRILGMRDRAEDGTIRMRNDDFQQMEEWIMGDRAFYRIESKLYYEEYYALLQKMFVENGTITNTTYIPVYAYSYLYFFSGLGIALGRMLNLGVLWTFLLGRFFNVAIFTASICYAIKKIPFGKVMIFIWALLPITLQQVASLSYDVVILALSAIIISLTLKMTYDSVSEVKKSEKIILFICVLLLSPTKLLALTPLCVLPLVILSTNRDKKKYILSMIAAMIFVIILFNLEPINAFLSVGNKNISHLYTTDDMGYELGYLLSNPKETFLIICNTVYETWDFVFETFLGRRLGHYEIILPLHMLLPFFIMLLISAMRKKDEPQYLTGKIKLFFAVIVFMGYGFATGGMLLTWTRTSLQHIDGVQGRYLLPFAMLAFLLLRSERILVDKELDSKLVFGTTFLQLLSFFCFYRFFF